MACTKKYLFFILSEIVVNFCKIRNYIVFSDINFNIILKQVKTNYTIMKSGKQIQLNISINFQSSVLYYN